MSNIDKKSIIKDLHKAAVISIFAVGYSMPGKKILKTTPPSIQKFDPEDMRKAGCYCCCIRDDARVSHQAENPTRTH